MPVSREMMDNECERIKIPLQVLEENKEGVEEGEDKRRFDFPPFWQIGILGRVCESHFQILPFYF
jgi:hypothetical protein